MEKIMNDRHFKAVRFVCDCMAQEHCMDVATEVYDNGKKHSQIWFEMYLAGKPSFIWRVKQAWKALKGKDGSLGDFILRNDDIPSLIEFLETYNKE